MKRYRQSVLLAVLLAVVVVGPSVQAAKPVTIFPYIATPLGPLSRSSQLAPVDTYSVVNTWPHDPQAFTQGLVFQNGVLFESTGLNGHSSLRKVELQTGKVLQKVDIPDDYFAEGLALWRGKLFQLTWQSKVGFVYDLETFEKQREWAYEGEGWGLTTDGESMIMSDGTNQIRFLDPTTLETQRTISVFDNGKPVKNLNELEYVKGEIYANVWETDYVVRIDPTSGKVLGRINFTGLLQRQGHPQRMKHLGNVLNGIAYDAARDRLFVTGKRWSQIYEVRIIPYGAYYRERGPETRVPR